MTRAMHIGVSGLMLLTVAGCVSQVRYDRVIEQLNTIRKDLAVAKAEELALTQEATRLDSLKLDARADVVAASADLDRAKEAADAERQTAEGQFATLQRAISQLSAHLLTVKDKLAEAKADTVALNEVVVAYQRKLRAEVETTALEKAPARAVEQAPVGPVLLEPLQAAPKSDVVSAEALQPVQPVPDRQAPQRAEPAEPPDGGLLSFILGWLISFWESLVSLWRVIFP